jgi:hypothetical protein
MQRGSGRHASAPQLGASTSEKLEAVCGSFGAGIAPEPLRMEEEVYILQFIFVCTFRCVTVQFLRLIYLL